MIKYPFDTQLTNFIKHATFIKKKKIKTFLLREYTFFVKLLK